MKTRTPLPLLAGLLSLAAMATPAEASSLLAVDINDSYAPGGSLSGSNSSSTSGETLGYAFTLTQSVTVTTLGVLDYVLANSTGEGAQVGLLTDHLVRIWDSTGTSVLASGTVSAGTCSNAVETASSNELSSWCFVDIADVALAAGTYVISADYGPDSGDVYRFQLPESWVTVMSGMSLGDAHNRPDNAYSLANYGYFGPNFQIADAGTVPEPGSLALLALGLAGIGAVRRRKLAA